VIATQTNAGNYAAAIAVFDAVLGGERLPEPHAANLRLQAFMGRGTVREAPMALPVPPSRTRVRCLAFVVVAHGRVLGSSPPVEGDRCPPPHIVQQEVLQHTVY
jgi:hypothetical protein